MLRWIFKSHRGAAPEPSTPGPPRSPGVGVEDPVVAVPQKLDTAVQSHRAGRLSEAEAAYSEVLAVDPENIDALHFLGVIAYQRGEHGRAEELISRALSRNASNAPAYSNLGNALGAQGKLDAAIVCYQKALALKPDFAEAFCSLGNVLRNQDRLDEALDCLNKALALKPDFPEAYDYMGNTLIGLGRSQEAEESYRRALALRPDSAELKLGYSLLKLLLGDYETGFLLYESRLDKDALPQATYSPLQERMAQLGDAPRWQGE